MSINKAGKLTYIPELDGLRAIAIIAVMLFHFWTYNGPNFVGKGITTLSTAGWAGVDIFFAISGFLITGILLDAKESDGYFRTFFIRRSLRIFPLYYAIVTMILVSSLLIIKYQLPIYDPTLETIDKIWINYLYLTNFAVGVTGDDSVPLAIAWSLAIEEQFYLVYPVVVLYVSRCNLKRILFACLLLAPIIRAVTFLLTDNAGIAYTFPFCRMDNLAVGGLVMLILRYGSTEVKAWVPWSLVVFWGLAIVFLFTWTRHEFPFIVLGYSTVGMATAATIFCLRVSGLHFVSKLLCLPVMVYIGRISYGLYLLHLFVRVLIDQVLFSGLAEAAELDFMAAVLRMVLLFAGSVAAASLSWYLFEAPILLLKRRFAPSSSEAVK